MRRLAHIARTYDKGYGHLTTRQNIQYNWPKLEDIPEILASLADVEMHAIQTSGNCIRNISADQLAGVAGDELEDPRPYAEILRQWSTFHPEFAQLPRKFKFALTGSDNDRAAIAYHDIGYKLVENDAGEVGFQIFVGGGMGRTPMIGKEITPWIEKRHLLAYTESMLRVYNGYGRRDNKYKARIKILVHEMGIAEYRTRVEDDFKRSKEGALDLDDAEIARMQAFFAAPAYENLSANDAIVDGLIADDKNFSRWHARNVEAHKENGYSIVSLSLKTKGVAPGDVTADQMDEIARLADQYSLGVMRTTHKQNIVFTDVKIADLPSLWADLKKIALADPNIETLTDLICCPGLDFCALANARSIPIADQILNRFDDIDFVHDLGDIRLNISGCINACGHHHAGNIGILGVDKKGEEFYQITLGGSSQTDASIGKIVGPAFSYDEIVPAIANVLETFVSLRDEDERFLDCYRRVGIAPFKERLYENH
jgi:sulfite reductase (NADPH) hemoprotein beta-component